MPKIKSNLLSVHQFCKDNHVCFEFHTDFFVVKDKTTGALLLKGRNENGLYVLDGVGDLNKQATSFFSASIPIWHQRLGHPMLITVSKIVNKFSLPFLNKNFGFCHSCHISKSKRLPFSRSATEYAPLSLVVSDIWVSPKISRTGYRYYLLIMDAFSHYTWVFPMIKRSDVFHIFTQFHKQVENLTGHKIKVFQSDNALEYKKLTSYLNNSGIQHRFSCPHTSPQNGLAERRI